MNHRDLLTLLDSAVLPQLRQHKPPSISPEAYALLVTMFPNILAATLDILDNGRVTKFVCQLSKRSFYR